MGKITTSTVAGPLAQLSKLVAQPGRDFLGMANQLNLLREIAPAEFNAHLKQIGLSRRAAYYLLEMPGVQERLKLAPADLLKIGWTKLQLIGRYLNRDNEAELVAAAQKLTVAQLRSSLGHASANPGRCMLLRFTPNDYETLRAALLANGAVAHGKGLTGAEAAILKLIG